MAIDPRSKEGSISTLITEMVEDYRDVADPGTVEAELRGEYERLCRQSNVTDFVPVFAERRAREHLNRRFRGGAAASAGPSAERLQSLNAEDGSTG
jgi:hypothetical protein